MDWVCHSRVMLQEGTMMPMQLGFDCDGAKDGMSCCVAIMEVAVRMVR